jgi:hypothetical protein
MHERRQEHSPRSLFAPRTIGRRRRYNILARKRFLWYNVIDAACKDRLLPPDVLKNRAAASDI